MNNTVHASVRRLLVIAALVPGGLLAMNGSSAAAQAVPVEVIQKPDGAFILHRDDVPYEVRGVSGYEFLDEAVAAGATTIRTWGVRHLDEGRLLDEAHRRGLTVLVGLWLGHKRDGFDYGNPGMVRKQFEEKSAIVLRYKDHPAVLAWGVGNEAEARGGQPWAAIQQLAEFIKEVDPHHPTVCVIAGASEAKLRTLKEECPAIDIAGVNVYRAYRSVAENVRDAGWDKPYFVTEMGIDGSWEARQTAWGARIEPPSADKAETYRRRFIKLAEDRSQCLGLFPFKWGYVPKGTSTWFSLFHENGEPNAVVDTLHHLWRGEWPEARAPRVTGISVNGQPPRSNLILRPGQEARVWVLMSANADEGLETHWYITPENPIRHRQGSVRLSGKLEDAEPTPLSDTRARFMAPAEPGEYRIYFKAISAYGKIGTANFPFLVE